MKNISMIDGSTGLVFSFYHDGNIFSAYLTSEIYGVEQEKVELITTSVMNTETQRESVKQVFQGEVEFDALKLVIGETALILTDEYSDTTVLAVTSVTGVLSDHFIEWRQRNKETVEFDTYWATHNQIYPPVMYAYPF